MRFLDGTVREASPQLGYHLAHARKVVVAQEIYFRAKLQVLQQLQQRLRQINLVVNPVYHKVTLLETSRSHRGADRYWGINGILNQIP